MSLFSILGRTSIIQPSIIRNLDYPAWQFSKKISACQQLLPWTQECLSSAHAQTPTFTAVYQLSGWIKAWFILLVYSVIRHGSGTKVSG